MEGGIYRSTANIIITTIIILKIIIIVIIIIINIYECLLKKILFQQLEGSMTATITTNRVMTSSQVKQAALLM